MILNAHAGFFLSMVCFCTVSGQQSLSLSELLSTFELAYAPMDSVSATTVAPGVEEKWHYQYGVSLAGGSAKVLCQFVPDEVVVSLKQQHVECLDKVSASATAFDSQYFDHSSEPTRELNADYVIVSSWTASDATYRPIRKLISMYREGIGVLQVYQLYGPSFVPDPLFEFLELE